MTKPIEYIHLVAMHAASSMCCEKGGRKPAGISAAAIFGEPKPIISKKIGCDFRTTRELRFCHVQAVPSIETSNDRAPMLYNQQSNMGYQFLE
jgi:hypothetical protein